MKDYERSLSESKSYLEMAEKQYENQVGKDTPMNAVVVNCIMSMIKSVDALMLKHRGKVNKDHSKTANELKKLYEEKLISEDFSSNINSVRKWVVDRKTDIQYRNQEVSVQETDRALKSSKRLLRKVEKELN